MNVQERLGQLLQGEGGSYILPFFWQHGEDEATLREYMGAIYASNIREVCVESRPHPDFAGPKWWQDMDVILDEAQKRGMRVWILDDSHFPTGYANGAVETAPAELCHQYLDYNTADVCGPLPLAELDVAAMAHPKPAPPWLPPAPPPKRVFNDDRLYRVVACRIGGGGAVAESCDLTGEVKNGRLKWQVPAGYWRVFVVYLTRDAKGRNDYINFLDAASCRLLVDAVYEPHYARYSHLFGSVIAGFFSDEPPIGNTPGYTAGDLIGNPAMALPWSAAMPARLAEYYGEGWETALPLLWAQGVDRAQTARARVAYMDAVSTQVAECFSAQLGGWCEAHGVEYIGHMLEDCDSNANLGPSMGHFFRGLSGQHMAGIDNIGGQVLPGGQHVQRRPGGMCQDDAGFYHYTLGRLGASHAAIDPKKQGRCLCENLGAYGWQVGMGTQKYLMDHFLVRGVNRFVPHAFSPKAFPDPDCPPHFYAHGENPQFRAFGELMAYTGRLCHLIDGGTPHAPVALLYHGESQWAGEYESNILACRALTRSQFGFVILPADVFAKPEEYNTRFDAQTGVLSVNGIELGALVVSGCEGLPAAAASFAGEVAGAGFPVVFTGRRPAYVVGGAGGQGTLLAGLEGCPLCAVQDLPETLAAFVKKDARLERPFPDLTVYRYRNGGEVYLFLNESPDEAFAGRVEVDATGPALRYDAWTNTTAVLPTAPADGGSGFKLHLAPLEGCAVIFGPGLPEGEVAQEYETGTELPAGAFTLRRCTAKEYPHFGPAEALAAADMQQGMQARYPEFSGYYRYEATLPEAGGAVYLEIDAVYDSAELFVNGVSAGHRVAPPYRWSLQGLLAEDENRLAIEVATTLERRLTAQGIDVACMNFAQPLAPTGITGSVRLQG